MNYTFECACHNITSEKWEELMKGARPAARKTVVKAAFECGLMDKWSYDQEIKNPYFNPYNHKRTKTHLIYIHSAIEHFIKILN